MNTDWITSMLEWFKTHSDITTVIVVVLFFWMWVRSKKRSRKINNLTPNTTPTSVVADMAPAKEVKEKPAKSEKKEGDGGWTKLMKFITETAKAVICVSLCALAIFAAVRGFQIVRDWEPARSVRGGGSEATIILTEEWSSEYLKQNWRNTRSGIKIIPKTTRHGILFRFDSPDGTPGKVFEEKPGQNVRYTAPKGDSILRIKLAGDEPGIVQAKVWWQ